MVNFTIDQQKEGESMEMTRTKFAGLLVIAGILMWYFCPWLARIISGTA